MEDRKLDVWVIYRDPEEVLTALKNLLEHKDEITKESPLRLYVNCYSTFTVDGKPVGRHMDTLLVSNQADMALCLSSARYTDEDLGLISATPEDVVRFLEKNDIPYEVITGQPQMDDIDDPDFPETWLARERYVLEDSIDDSISKGCTDCTVYPETKSKLSMGYYLNNGEYVEIWGLNFNGIVETDNSWTFLINENDERNISIEEAKNILGEKGLNYSIGQDPLGNLASRKQRRL